LLAVAKKQRVIVSDYLRQEIDFSEPFAFVEYWGPWLYTRLPDKIVSRCRRSRGG